MSAKKEEKDIPLIISRPHDINKYKPGQKVWVAYNVGAQPGWENQLADKMFSARGKKFKVESCNAVGIALTAIAKDDDKYRQFRFAEAALLPDAEFKVGDTVDVTMMPLGWVGCMDALRQFVGTQHKVTANKDDDIKLDEQWNFPPYALQKVGVDEGPVPVEVAAQTKKRRRVRVGAGPWDQAPCTHLRWHLMGFFREKLAFKKTRTKVKVALADGTLVEAEAEVASVEVVCTKCNKTMTLNAK